MPITVTIDTTNLTGLIGSLPRASAEAVDAVANDIRQLASQLAPRLTGSLSASIYVGTPTGSDYGQQSSEARSLNSQAIVVDEILPEFVLSLTGDTDAYLDVVGVAVQHGVYQEFGTRYQPAQPYLFPAVESGAAEFVNRMGGIVNL